ncbi:B3 domain-containing protein [Quillaja saponaria]|nr:B3 domain-containing protein [Quillaja saponaria]
MGIPVKIQQILPCTKIPTVLSYRGKKWKMLYNGKNVKHKRFDGSWRTFVNDNKLKVGDACVFELMEKSEKGLNFRVQILRGDIPSKFLNMVNGESINAPIMIG